MEPETPEHYMYVIDASDRITFVSPEWLRFAETNEAPELTEANVVGKPIWDFVTGADTRTFYEAIYHNLRIAAPRLPFLFAVIPPPWFGR